MLTIPTKEELLDFSRFDLNAILRGAQLTFVGGEADICETTPDAC